MFLTTLLTSPRTPALTLADSMDQLSQQSSSSRTQFMSREDLDQEGSLDLEHEQYQDPDQSIDQELEQHQAEEPDQRKDSTPTKTLEVKVETCTRAYTIHRHWSQAFKIKLDHIVSTIKHVMFSSGSRNKIEPSGLAPLFLSLPLSW